jgi:RNA polymerase sigma-70 factor (ECF subfamily)
MPDPSDAGNLTSIHVRSALGGNQEGLAWVVGHLQPFLEAHIRRRIGAATRDDHDVADLAEDTWVVTLQSLQQLEPQGGRYAPVLVKFLSSTATNLCNNFLRRRIRERTRTAEPVSPTPSQRSAGMDHLVAETRGVLSRVQASEQCRLIEQCLAALPAGQREVLLLRLFEGLGNQAIAAALGLPANTVAVRYRRALEHLRARLPDAVFDEVRSFRSAP